MGSHKGHKDHKGRRGCEYLGGDVELPNHFCCSSSAICDNFAGTHPCISVLVLNPVPFAIGADASDVKNNPVDGCAFNLGLKAGAAVDIGAGPVLHDAWIAALRRGKVDFFSRSYLCVG